MAKISKEAIASLIGRSCANRSDLAQSLQYFVSQIPRDTARLLSWCSQPITC